MIGGYLSDASVISHARLCATAPHFLWLLPKIHPRLVQYDSAVHSDCSSYICRTVYVKPVGGYQQRRMFC